jgi:MarR family transcriptional regulator, organic hydroperoxide resistance regulator
MPTSRRKPAPSDTDAPTALRPEDFVCFSVYSAAHAFTRVYKPLLEALGLTYPQYLVMVALWARDDTTVGGLGEQLFLESNTLTPLLKRLEKLGLVTRERDTADERQVRICLTDQGRILKAKAKDIPDCIGAATGLPAASVERLRTEIVALRDNLLAAQRAPSLK